MFHHRVEKVIYTRRGAEAEHGIRRMFLADGVVRAQPSFAGHLRKAKSATGLLQVGDQDGCGVHGVDNAADYSTTRGSSLDQL
jgi:hypothetical protein